MVEVPHPSEANATTTIEVIPNIVIEEPTQHMAVEASTTGDIEVTSLIKIDLTAHHETFVTDPASTDPLINTDEGFPGGPSECSILTRYANLMAFKLWKGEVCILYANDLTLFINDTLKLMDAFYTICYRFVFCLRCPPMG